MPRRLFTSSRAWSQKDVKSATCKQQGQHTNIGTEVYSIASFEHENEHKSTNNIITHQVVKAFDECPLALGFAVPQGISSINSNSRTCKVIENYSITQRYEKSKARV